MQAAVPVGEGAMAAIIGLDQDEVEAACREAGAGSVCQIANDNGGGQFVDFRREGRRSSRRRGCAPRRAPSAR